ncbi:hypothetical protein P378_04820 [Desulforamulus profundi]|uniref:Uncharacterized protein n=1 Tax=Desulforamulus profundi TaxID=1383067 RepID=A0A2C6MHK2_9FIRM|nr:DUF2892 domain-containing protein [Desulforamulus profundi]MCL4440272.1 DUF2892 domain-containing protein [Bacillota bacterium]MCL5780868.1 DUF2892 domain-containing protein [Bacillota bacterium]PHJ39245.1 hypothetical protein P378_04820 [Desulforamulus profundi]
MRQNMNFTERLLSVVGGLAFTGLGRSENFRKSMLGKGMALLGLKTTAVGIIGYDPVIDWLGQEDEDEDFF